MRRAAPPVILTFTYSDFTVWVLRCLYDRCGPGISLILGHGGEHLVIVRSGVPLVGDPVWLAIHRCYWFTKTKTHLGASGHSWPVRLPSANRTLPVYVTENCWPVCCWVNPHFMSPHMLMVVCEWYALAYRSDHLTIEGIALGFDTSCLKNAVGGFTEFPSF